MPSNSSKADSLVPTLVVTSPVPERPTPRTPQTTHLATENDAEHSLHAGEVRTESAPLVDVARQWWSDCAPDRDIHDYVIGRCIGEGSFGSVWLAIRRSEVGPGHAPQELAIKVVPVEKFKEDEVVVQRAVPHETIVQVFEWFTEAGHVYIVMEYMSGGDLFDFVKMCKTPNDESVVLKFFQQMLASVMVVHSQGIIHHDIKLENFLLSSDRNVVKLCDFGSAEFAKDRFAATERFTGSVFAPEKCARNGAYNGFLADEFQLGKTLHELEFGLNEPHPTMFAQTHVWLCDLIDCMCQVDPNRRIPLECIPEHRWMAYAIIPNLQLHPISNRTANADNIHPQDQSSTSTSTNTLITIDRIDESVQTEGNSRRQRRGRGSRRKPSNATLPDVTGTRTTPNTRRWKPTNTQDLQN